MASKVTDELAGWGRCPVEPCHVYRPEKRARVAQLLASGDQPSFIPRGLGRSYGDAALNRDAGVILHTRLDRFLDLEAATGRLTLEAGVSLAEVIEHMLPRGYFPPVVPGTQFVTVGGAIAGDIHGKNHHRDGAFSSCVESFELLTPPGKVLTCSRDQNPQAFWATLGGMGLTGSILTATLQLTRVESAYVRTTHRKASNLEETLALFQKHDPGTPYSVAWIDCLARGDKLGRSILMTGEHASADAVDREDPLRPPQRSRRRVPFRLPSKLLNKTTGRLFNALYYHLDRAREDRVVTAERFFFPLDALLEWNKVYGNHGFVQYQFVVPPQAGAEAVRQAIQAVQEAGVGSFLAVLKRMGPEDQGMLSFPMEGWTLALDLPAGPKVSILGRRLDEIVLEYGGRVYLAKDALLDAATFEAMYPGRHRFLEARAELDPEGVLSSSLSRRVGLTAPVGGGA